MHVCVEPFIFCRPSVAELITSCLDFFFYQQSQRSFSFCLNLFVHSGWSRPVSQTLLSPFHSLLRRSFQFVELVFLWEYHHIVCDNKRESAQDYWCFQNKKTKRHTENLSDHKTSSVLQYMVSRHIIHQTNPKISSTKIRYEHTSDPQAPTYKKSAPIHFCQLFLTASNEQFLIHIGIN